MTQEQTFKEAFGYLQRYGVYRLLRALGQLIIYVGIGVFLTSWTVMAPLNEYLTMLGFLLDLPCTAFPDECEVQAFLMTMSIQLLILVILAVILLVIMVPIALSLSKTFTKNRTIDTRRLIVFIGIIFVLFFTTFHNLFIDQIMWWLQWLSLHTAIPFIHSLVQLFGLYWGVSLMILPIVFWPTVGLVVIYYLVRKEFPKFDFREVRYFGYALFVLCFVDISVKIINGVLIFQLLFNPTLVIWAQAFGLFYFAFNYVILATYIIAGWLIFHQANRLLVKPFATREL